MKVENPSNRPRQNEANSGITLGDIFQIVKSKWYWFVLSIGVCLGIAYIYLLQAPKVYTRSASVLIKEDRRSSRSMSAYGFSDLNNMLGIQRNVDNEVIVFKTYRLMEKVARRLHLDISYTEKRGLRTVELYRQSPVTLSFPDASETQSFSLTVVPVSKDKVRLSDFVTVNEAGKLVEIEKPQEVVLNDTVATPIGRVVVQPSLYYTDTYYNKEVHVRKSNLKGIATGYQNALVSELVAEYATIIKLSLSDVSASRAEDVLNTLIAVYNEDAIEDKNRITVSTSEFIAERLVIIEQELGSVDTDIETFKREHQLTDITSETGMYLQNTSQYRKEGLSLENQLSVAQYIRDYLADPQKALDLIPANTITDVTVEQQISAYNEMLLKRDNLIRNSSNKNPVVMDLNNSLSAMKQTIIRSVDNLIAGLNISIRNVQAQEEQLQKRIAAVPSQQKYVLTVERQQKIKEELYLYLLNKREENALSQAMTESNTRILDAAHGSNAPVSPRSRSVILVAFVLGACIPGGILWLLFTMDTKVHTRKDLLDATTIPFLGEVPIQSKKDKEMLVVREGSRDAVSEAFRIIRTNMNFMHVKGQDMKVVVFTSLNAGAGKTYISSNLAMSLVLTQKKVVLVDLDIRKSGFARHGSHGQKGVTNYLSDKDLSVDEVIVKDNWVKGLDLIYSGPIPPNPAELLLSDRLDQLVAELRKRYDYVIVDNVPAGIVADASIVNRIADLTICIVRAGAMDRRQLPELERMYTNGMFTNMAVILNYVNLHRGSYGYSYGYGYGYGYGNENKKEKKQ